MHYGISANLKYLTIPLFYQIVLRAFNNSFNVNYLKKSTILLKKIETNYYCETCLQYIFTFRNSFI